MLIILIGHFVLHSALILIFPWLFWSLHMRTLTTVYHSVWHVDSLTCILSWSSFEHDVHIAIHPDSCSFCVDMSDISCTLLDCMTRDCLPSAWLHVACLCGPHIYPLISNSLGFGHSFHPGSHYCKCETFCVFALWPSQRLEVGSSDGLYRCTGAFWRRATLWCRLESDHWRPV